MSDSLELIDMPHNNMVLQWNDNLWNGGNVAPQTNTCNQMHEIFNQA